MVGRRPFLLVLLDTFVKETEQFFYSAEPECILANHFSIRRMAAGTARSPAGGTDCSSGAGDGGGGFLGDDNASGDGAQCARECDQEG
jgi:hypothetical protein